MIPPYGTPPPYVMYPPGVYAHPSMPPVCSTCGFSFTMYLSNGNADLGCHCTIVQGAHPFTPYAITSPNGNADATVRHDIFRFVFLVRSMGEPNVSMLCRELLLQLVILMASPLKAKIKVQQSDPKEVWAA
jgi:hypothetical protein